MIASFRNSYARWFRATNQEAPETNSGEVVASTLPHIPKIGLALSSGGARGLAHVGVIQVLEEEGVPIAAIAGTSMGAYIGSLWAAGLSGAKLEELAREIKDRKTLLRLLDPLFPPSEGLIRGEKIRKHLERSLGTLDFSELAKPLLIIATDLDDLSAHVFDSGPVAAAVHASSAIQGVCAPVRLKGRRFVDGGASEPLPVSLLKARYGLDAVIAVNVMPTPADIRASGQSAFDGPPREPANIILRWLSRMWRSINLLAYGNVMDTFRRSLMTAQLRLVAKESERADILIHPLFKESTWFDYENFDRYISAGREAARAALPQIRATLQPMATKGGGHYEIHQSNPTMGLDAA
jgi:NTE family protein